MKYLSLAIEGLGEVNPPQGVPSGGSATFDSVVTVAFALFVAFGIIMAIGFIIWGGMRWSTSGGDKEKIEKARKTIIYAIVGIILIALSAVIVRFIGNIIGAELLTGN